VVVLAYEPAVQVVQLVARAGETAPVRQLVQVGAPAVE
jgi:hypothetical protein